MTTKEQQRLKLEQAVNQWLQTNTITKLEAITVKELPKNYYLDEDNSLLNSFKDDHFMQDHLSVYDPNAEYLFS